MNGLLWRAAGALPVGGRGRPLLVMVHGGPTGQSLADWTPQVQAFVQRGWSVLQPDYRGSTGHGRAYTQALAGRWGERDVADVAAGIRHAVKEGWADASRVAIVGGSAGGMTALLVAAQYPDLVQAVVARYPVCDLVDLALTTHRFESTYTYRLVGPLPDAADIYRDRSPIARAAEIRVPVLLLPRRPGHVGAGRAIRGRRRRAAPPVRRSSATCTPARVTAGGERRRSPTTSNEFMRS